MLVPLNQGVYSLHEVTQNPQYARSNCCHTYHTQLANMSFDPKNIRLTAHVLFSLLHAFFFFNEYYS